MKKVALILGSIKGIGKAIGLALSKKGINVALNYFDWEDSLEDLKNDFKKIGIEPLIIKTNLLETDNIKSLIKKVIDRFGRLDILINNIERGGWPIVHGPYNQDQWDLELETTLRAKRWVFENALIHLKESGNGIVINISSIAAIVGRSGPVSYIFNDGYSAANSGISILTKTWAKIGAPEVRVNEIMLGIFETRHGNKTRGWGLLTKDQKQDIIDHTLLKRIGKIEDIVKAVMFFIFEGFFITGSTLRIDGGYILGSDDVKPMPEGVLRY